ncbi:Nardilysin [Clonorchis sinensis]|uniref:Nardilysin n=1 Tax=Clonorchis sinensis TaxID=79923 RepID=A0A8T1N003_CLOSI|nr:Nardilysin [Clonorchis sinensis]
MHSHSAELQSECGMSMHIDLSTNDTRDYRYRELENGLRVLLLSSPENLELDGSALKNSSRTDNMSAACLCIRFGSFSDPVEMPGCANLLSRVLTLGSKTFTGANSFNSFLQQNNGESGAYCTYEYTTFCFQIGAPHLEGALMRFVTLFECPELPEEGIKQALSTIDTEYRKLKVTDQAAIRQFISFLAKDGSPFHKFHKGNSSSIRGKPEKSTEAIRQILLEQFAAYYSAHHMTLVVQSSHSLDNLERMISELFSRLRKIPAADVSFAQHTDSFNNQNFMKFYKVIPNRPKEVLRLVWCLACLRSQYRANPLLILSSLLKNMNEGGLAHYLDENFLATDLDCDFGTLCEFSNSTICTFFVLRMNLTQTGTQRIPEICGAVYDYLKFLAEEAGRCLNQWDQSNWDFLWNDDPHTFATYVQELKIVQESRFIDQPVHPAYVSTISLANMMHRVSKEDLYSGYFLVKETNFQLYHDLITRLSKQNLCIIWCAPDLTSSLDKDTRLMNEQTTGLKYIACDIPAEVTERRLKERPQIRFSLPAKNRMIGEQFMQLPCSNDLKLPADYNAHDDRARYRDYGSLWIQASKDFENPKATFAIRITSAIALESVRNSTLLILFVEELRQTLSNKKREDYHKRMQYELSVIDGGFEIRVSGPSKHIREFYYSVISTAFRRTASMDIEMYESLRALVKSKLSQSVADLDTLVLNLFHYLTHKPAFLLTEQLETLGSITIADQMAFVTQLLCQLRITAYGRGDMDIEEIKSMYDRTIRSISCIPATSIREIRPIAIPPGTYHFEQENSGASSQQALFGRYCIPSESNAYFEAYNQAIVELLQNEAPTFFTDPTATGTKVLVRYLRLVSLSRGPGAIVITVQLNAHSKLTEYMGSLLSAFWICVAPQIIAGVDSFELQRVRSQLTCKIRRQFSTVDRPFDTNWNLISTYDAEFEMAKLMITHVNGMTREKLLNFFVKNYVDPGYQKSIMLKITPPSKSTRKKPHSSSNRNSGEDFVRAHMKQYFAAAKLDCSTLNKHSNLQAVIARAYPEASKKITDTLTFRQA